MFFGPERTTIYGNPYGTALLRRHGLHERLASFGWSVHSITHALQPRTDDYQCGVWVHVALDLFLRYMTEARKATVSGFEQAMAQHEDFKPIPPSGSGRVEATRANVRHATAVRAQLRAVLWQAAVAGKLDGLNAQLEHLGARAGEEIDVDTAPTLEDDDGGEDS